MVYISFLLIVSSDFSVSVESSPVLFSDFFSPPIVISSLIYSVKSTTNILLGVPLFSLLFLVYVRIIICTIEVTANTQQVLSVPAQTVKPLQLHRPIRFTSCPTDWIPYAMFDP